MMAPSKADISDWRSTLSALTDDTMTALAAAWAGWPWTDAQATTDAALIAVPMIVTTYADIASGIAADQYDQWRDGVAARGRFRASPAQIAEEFKGVLVLHIEQALDRQCSCFGREKEMLGHDVHRDR